MILDAPLVVGTPTIVSGNIADFVEAVQDALNSTVVGDAGISVVYDDVANTLTIGLAGGADAVYKDFGSVNLGTGSYPTAPSESGIWIVSGGGTVSGTVYQAGDLLTFSASTSQFHKIATSITPASIGALSLAGGTTTGVTVFGKAAHETAISMAANVIDLSLGSVFTKTISGTTGFSTSNVPASGVVASFILDLTNGGSAAITWWSGIKWPNGATPLLTAAGRDILGFFTTDGGSTWVGLVLGKDVK